ncbi:MAG: hypothetical protein ACU85E_05095 [Gammaproteobacteria bacterium]
MAKSFLDQLLDMAGLKLPDAKGHYAPSVYRDEPKKEADTSGLSRVEKYLQKKDAESEKASTELTGVAKYLAEKQQAEKEQAEAAASASVKSEGQEELTGVAKYLAKIEQESLEQAEAQAAALANMTGVAKYLARLEGGRKPVQRQAETKQPTKQAPLSRVEQYLAKQKEAPVSAQPVKTASKEPQPAPAPKAAPAEQKAASPAKATQQKPAAAKSPEPAPVAEPKAAVADKPASKLIDLAENAEQCQASTAKGSQCRRKANLEVIHKTIHKQKYKFAVCSQHNNSDFAPFSELLVS